MIHRPMRRYSYLAINSSQARIFRRQKRLTLIAPDRKTAKQDTEKYGGKYHQKQRRFYAPSL